MKKQLLILLFWVGFLNAQTLQNPTFGTVTTKTNVISDNAPYLSVQENDGKNNKTLMSNFAKKAYVDNADLLKQNLPTGFLQGLQMSINADPTKFNIASGYYIVTDFTNLANPVVTVITYPGATGVTPTYLASSNATYIALDKDQNIIQSATPFTNAQRRTLAIIGAAIHSNHITINTTNEIKAPVVAPTNQLHDLMKALGTLNESGNVYSANGANLSLNKSAGTIAGLGINAVDYTNPHELTIGAQTALTFRYRTQTGAEGSDVTVINPNSYDNAGTITSVPVNRWTVQRINLFQSGMTRTQYGQALYTTFNDAYSNFRNEAFITEQNIADNAIFRAYLIVKQGVTNLAASVASGESKFIPVDKFGNVVTGGSVALTYANIIAALGFTPENAANKSDSYTDSSSTTYASTKALVDGLDTTMKKLTIAQIRTLSGTLNSTYYVTDSEKEGVFKYDSTDITSADNTGTILVTTDGKRYKRVFNNNEINISWFITNKLPVYYASGISINSGTNVLNVTGANFDASYIGSKVKLYAGGAGGTFLVTTITGINSATQVTLAINSSSTLMNQQGIIGGFDETPRFQSAMDILNIQGGRLVIPKGRYYIDGTIYVKPSRESILISVDGQNDMVLQDGWAVAANGVSLIKNTTGDFFRVNMNEAGVGILTYPKAYYGFSAKGISFIGDDVTPGINAFNIFRSRVVIQNISAHRIDYVVKQLATDISGSNPTYCDMSLYKNIRISYSKLGGLMLRFSDASTVSELYFESGDTNSKHALEVYNTASIFVYNILHGEQANEQKTAGSAFVMLNQVFGGTFTGMHFEDCNFESLFNITNSGGLAVNGIQTTLTRNSAFKLNFIKGLKISNWYDYSTPSIGSYDIDFGTNNGNRDITWDNISTFDTSQTAGSLRRDLALNNTSFRGLTYMENTVEYISDLNTIDGYKHFRSLSGASNLPAGVSFLSGEQYLLADNNNYRVQKAMSGDFIYTRYMTNGVWGNWNRILNAADLNNMALTGVPTAPTTPANTNTTQVATTANVVSTVNNRISGTTNYISKFTGSNTIGNSQLQDDGIGVGIGGGPNTSAKIRLTTDTALQYGVLMDTQMGQTSSSAMHLVPTFNSNVLTRGIVQRVALSTAASPFTLPELRGFSAEIGTIGAGSAVTNLVGFYATNLDGGTNTYGFRSTLVAGAGKWNLYFDGTAKNHLQGTTLIGTTTDSGAAILQVAGNGSFSGTVSGADATASTNFVTKAQLDAVKPYKVYVARMSQSGTGSPTATVLENTIGSIVWTRTSTGQYVGTLSGAFTTNKTASFISLSSVGGKLGYIGSSTANTVEINTQTASPFADADSALSGTIEIRVYP